MKQKPFYETVVTFIKRCGDPMWPISGRAISAGLDISSIDVRKYINEARSNGIPICSSSRGYYYSEDPNHIRKTIESLSGRIAAQEKAIGGLVRMANKMRV